MGWPPAVIIVVRHGARLDAADKQWHLTSPTPYDPPLTYGGWTQSRALGARIASILRSRETDDEIPIANDGELPNGIDKRKRRHKVIMHSSPFLRCVQTSVAISSGLAQNPGHIHTYQPAAAQSYTNFSQMHSSPKIRPTISTNSPMLAPIPEPVSSASLADGKAQEQPENIKKAILRVDAFLGEWLSPDYFELITPPPSSIMMVAGAKADLLRREDYNSLIRVLDISSAGPTHHHNQGFPGGWGSPIVLPQKEKDDGPLSNLSSLSQALPRRDRTSSLGSAGSNGSRHSGKGSTNTSLSAPVEHGIYQPPIPSYAISSSEPIPPGYVAHARDACVDVDYQWDSMREPQDWGNGGEYGEEWSAMHKRFRKGLQQLVGWYSNTEDPGKLVTRIKAATGPDHGDDNEVPEDQDTDLVIVLVTHGAGCNALIGAMTNQPVLLDVGMASLTMAVRKPTPVDTPISTPKETPKTHSRTSSRTISISEQYDVKLIANTEHLRSSSASTPSSSRTPSVTGIAPFRERVVTTGGSGDSFTLGKAARSLGPSGNFGNFGSMRRTASIATSAPRSYVPSRQSSIGLWSAPQPQDEEASEVEDNMILDFGGDGSTAKSPINGEEVAIPEKGEEDDLAPLGLWGSPRPAGYPEKVREIVHKRRWTVNERA